MAAMRVSGKLVIGLILAVAVLAATFSWWFRWQATHRAAEFWGVEAIAILQRPRQVIALQLNACPPDENAAASRTEQFPRQGVAAERVITTAGGVTHLRQALLEDRSYDWNSTIVDRSPARYALRLQSSATGQELILVFPDNCQWMRKAEIAASDAPLGLQPPPESTISTAPIADGLREYFTDVLGDDSPK